MLDWVALAPQIKDMADYLARPPEERAYALLKARRQLWRIAYAQRGIPVVGEFCVLVEGAYARHVPKDYAAQTARLAAETA